jgi:CheY-like chemotaxis protein
MAGQNGSALAALRPLLERHGDAVAAGVARELLSCEPTRSALADPERRAATLGLLRQTLPCLADPVGAPQRVRVQRSLGEAWAALGLGPDTALRAWSQLYAALMAHVEASCAGDARCVGALGRALLEGMLADAETLLRAYRRRRVRRLPARSGAAVPASDAARCGSRVPGRVLVVDTEPRWLDRIDAMLDDLRGRVCLVTDAREAIAMARLYPFDLAIIEWSLEGSRSGLELAQTLRRGRPEIACILTTSQPSEAIRSGARAAGAPRVLAKPFEADTLRAAVASLFAEPA